MCGAATAHTLLPAAIVEAVQRLTAVAGIEGRITGGEYMGVETWITAGPATEGLKEVRTFCLIL